MPENFRQRIILAAKEAVYGVDEVPTGAANAIQTSEPTITPLAGALVDRALLFSELGASPQIQVGSHVVVNFMVEIAGSGTVDTPPAYSPLLEACGFAETINAAVDVQYDPVSTGQASATLYFHQAGTLHKLLGARGTFTMEFPTDDVPHFNFTFTGLWADPAADTLPTAVFTAFQAPLTVSNANTPTFDLHGISPVMSSLTIDLGNTVVHRDRVNSESVLISGRESKGSVKIEAPAIGTKNFFTTAKSATLDTLQLIHGLTAGNIIQIDAPKVQLTEPGYSEEDDITMLEMGLILTRDTGDDDFKITTK